MRCVPIVLTILVAAGLSSCGRTSVTFTFGGDDSKLEETAVLGQEQHAQAKIALIHLRGVIVDARSGLPVLSSGVNPVDEFVARLDKARSDRDVKGVVVRINSPGGAVTASDTLYREVLRFKEQSGKPVVMSMGEVAASGGYYLALAGDRIIAQPTSITGSIGVIVPTVNISGGLRRIGIVSRAVKSGANKDLANPLEPMREEQYAVLQGLVDQMYDRFRGLVIERRGAMIAHAGLSLDELTDGRVFTGEEAHTHGLIDQLGDVHDAFEAAKQLAGVERASLVKYHGEGSTPKTAYAMVDPIVASDRGGVPSAGTEINLVRLNLGSADLATMNSGAAYYLWTMP